MNELQWKTEDGLIWVFINYVDKPRWRTAEPCEAAKVLQSAIAATQEKCAQWHDEQAARERAWEARWSAEFHEKSASAIRSLKMETGHE